MAVVAWRVSSSVSEINSWAFCNCVNLKEAVLNEGLKKIGGHAFAECRLLQSITFPSTLTAIGSTHLQAAIC